VNTIEIPSNIHNYLVHYGYEFQDLQEKFEDNAFYIIDKNVFHAFSEELSFVNEANSLLIDAVEEHKNLDKVIEIYKALLNYGFKRNSHLISIGGGIVQDISGFVASTLFRGVQWSFLPTTLLAQADSCVGSKTSLNLDSYKNTIGSFYPPTNIYILEAFLRTLSTQEIESGSGEIIKFLLLSDHEQPNVSTIKQLVKNVKAGKCKEAIYETHLVKKSYITQDEFDQGKRNLFNYGHCFGHALEYASSYAIPHGIAITIGMVLANIISFNRGLISVDCLNLLNKQLLLDNINVSVKAEYVALDLIIEALKKDKKRRTNDLTFVLLNNDEFSAGMYHDVLPSEVEQAINQLMEILDSK